MSLNINLINEFLANVKGAYLAKNKYATIKLSKHTYKLLRFLQQEGYISHFVNDYASRKILIYLKYDDNKPLLKTLKGLSKVGKSNNFSHYKLLSIYKKYPLTIISTKKGLMPISKAVKECYGGVLLFEFKL